MTKVLGTRFNLILLNIYICWNLGMLPPGGGKSFETCYSTFQPFKLKSIVSL